MESLELKTRLIDGEHISFSNEDHLMELSFRKTLGGSEEFIMMFNCKIIHMSKTWKSMWKKIQEKMNKHELEIEL